MGYIFNNMRDLHVLMNVICLYTNMLRFKSLASVRKKKKETNAFIQQEHMKNAHIKIVF